jgi:tRNA-2-methylthio-N6-dimethylallyladenosine synthase
MNKPEFKEEQNRNKTEIKYIKLNENIKQDHKGEKYFLRTYGCQMNVHDSEQIRAYLENMGYSEVDTLEESDIIVLNTCAVRENAKEKVFGFLGRAKHLKQTKKNLIICICGCLTQEPNEVDELMKNHKYVDIIIGTHNLNELPELINSPHDKQIVNVYSNSDLVYENIAYKRDSSKSAWINIMYGCNNFCTYCIVPYTRGRERSRKPECILEEVKELKENGYKEITLLGQNVNSYGKDLDNNYLFCNLLEDTAKIGVDRIRFVTSNPWNFTDDLIKVIKKYPNIMKYIHLPVQAGSNNILKKMNRPYTVEEYKELFTKIKKEIPNVTITTDIIVGFPNETEEDFLQTLDLVNYCKFDGAYTFIYSSRVGTIASKIEDNTPIKEKEDRLQRLNKLINQYSLESNKKHLNNIEDVLVVGPSDKGEDKVMGYTENMKLVNISNAKDKIGKIIPVKILEAKSFSLDGEYIENMIK